MSERLIDGARVATPAQEAAWDALRERLVISLRPIGAPTSIGFLGPAAEEERRAKEITQLDKSDVDDDGFDAALLLLRNAVLTHARHEERYEFPYLRAKIPATQLRALAPAVRAAEALAPTRPHAGAESAKANLAAGPLLAVVDRARDLIRDAVRKTDRPDST